jgi:amidohydrolase
MPSVEMRLTTWMLSSATLALSLTAAPATAASMEELLRGVEPQVTAWRRDIHEHPELSNREFRTSKLVAAHLKKLGLEVKTGIAHTGVAAFLKGGKAGPTIALRADMDGLPVTEKTDVPFKSKATDVYRGEKVGVMHACGHDTHVAILMGVAQALAGMREELTGNVLFIFQPAEEGAPEGEEGGAALMLEEGLFAVHKPEAVFGLHVTSGLQTGEIGYRSGPAMAAADSFRIMVNGKQSHGSRPWQGVDPIVTSAQIIETIQTVVSRRVDITTTPVIVSVGAIKGGIRHNIIPANVEMVGTIRTFTPEHRDTVMAEMKRIAENVAAANGATAEFTLFKPGYPVTANDPALTERMLPTLKRIAGAERVKEMELITGAEDFSFYAQQVPALFFFVGVTPEGKDPKTAPANHSDFFYADEAALPVGLKAMTHLTLDYLKASR